MSRRVLLDANLLMAAYDEEGTTTEEQRQKARQTILGLLADDSVDDLVITPLIRYEVLRGVSWKNDERYQQVQAAIQRFPELDIKRQVSELAADIFRYDRHQAAAKDQPKNLDKRRFDVFHFATAQHYGLELASQDNDIDRIRRLYAELQDEDRPS